MSMDSTPPSKDIIWQTGLKRKIQQSDGYRRPISSTNKHWLRVKGWKMIYQVNGLQKQAGVAILISDKLDFKLTLIK
jgi:hypothetical protein